MPEAGLEADMLKAHDAGDLSALVQLYTKAANLAETKGAIDRACFFLTHAYVFALEARDPMADELKARLVAHGREVAT